MDMTARVPEIGDYFAIPCRFGGFNIIKVLFPAEDGVHLRLYSNLYPALPDFVNIQELTLLPMRVVHNDDGSVGSRLVGSHPSVLAGALQGQKEAELFGVGHLPLQWEGFRNLSPSFVQSGRLDESDLDSLDAYLASVGLPEEQREQLRMLLRQG